MARQSGATEERTWKILVWPLACEESFIQFSQQGKYAVCTNAGRSKAFEVLLNLESCIKRPRLFRIRVTDTTFQQVSLQNGKRTSSCQCLRASKAQNSPLSQCFKDLPNMPASRHHC